MSLIEVFGSSQRLEIIRELTDGPMYVSQLADRVGMDGKSAVHHLSILEDAELLSHYYEGNRKYYRLERCITLEATPPPERSFIFQATQRSTGQSTRYSHLESPSD